MMYVPKNYAVWATTAGSTSPSQHYMNVFRQMQGINQSQGINQITTTSNIYQTASIMFPTDLTQYYVHAVAMSPMDEWYDPDPNIQVEHLYTTKQGYKIYLRRSGEIEITAPDDTNLEQLIRLHPKAKLLDAQGRVIELEPNGVIGVQALKNSTTRFIDIADPSTKLKDSLLASNFNKIMIPNIGCRLVLPNDVELKIDGDGKITINEADRKIFYEAAPRGFNRWMNASDVLEDFIRYLGTMEVRQRHVMKMPLGLFINWLIIAAAEADGDTADDLKPKLAEGVDSIKAIPRCLYCKRFLARHRHEAGINFCKSEHMDRYMAREDLVRLPKRARRQKRRPALLPPSATYFDRAA